MCVFLRRQLDGRLENVSKNFIWGEQSNQMQIFTAESQVVHLNACYVKVRRLGRWNIPALFRHQITWFNWEIEIMKSSCLGGGVPSRRSLSSFCVEGLDARRAQVAGCWPFLALMSYRFQPLAIFSIFNLFASFFPSSYWPHLTHWPKLAPLEDANSGVITPEFDIEWYHIYVIPFDHFLVSAASALGRRSSATFISKILWLTGTPPVRGLCCLVIPFLSAISVN
jgi:hypothetical protein